MMISLLDSGSHEIVYTSCGVLINMMVDCDKRSVLKEEGGIKKYVQLYKHCLYDRDMSSFVVL